MLSEIIVALDALSVAFVTLMQKELLYSSALFVLIFCLVKIFRKQSVYLHYGMWALLFVRLLMPPDWSFSLSARAFIDRFEFSRATPIESGPVANVERQAEPSVQATAGIPPLQKPTSSPASKSSDRLDQSLPYVSWQLIIFLAWALGCLIFGCIFVRRYLHYLGVVRKSQSVIDPNVLRMAQAWSSRFDLKRTVRFVGSDACLSPFTLGIFRPVVYLPSVLVNQSKPDSLESVIAHELAHVKQLDDLWIKVQNCVQLLYFFHPLVWIATSQMNQARERICDELVLSYGTISPKAYGKSMLAILKMNLLGVEGVEMLPSFGNHKKKFSLRIRDIANIQRIGKSNAVLAYVMTAFLAVFLLPMAQSSQLTGSDGEQVIKLRRAHDTKSDFWIQTSGAGSRFQKIELSKAKEMFCESNLPTHLREMEFAALGIFDKEYRKVWVLKGTNKVGAMEFYLDTNGDYCFTDEQPLKVKKKTAKYHYEGESEWVLTKYLKSEVMIGYQYGLHGESKRDEFPVYLVYDAKQNFLQFENNDFWIGEAKLGGDKYAVAVYGGLQSGWYLRPTFDETPLAHTKNQLRIDLNRNSVFEAMTVFDPATNQVVQENYLTVEPIVVNGLHYEVKAIMPNGECLELKLASKVEVTKTGPVSSSKS